MNRTRLRLVVALCALLALPAVAAAEHQRQDGDPVEARGGHVPDGHRALARLRPVARRREEQAVREAGHVASRSPTSTPTTEINAALAASKLDGANIATHTALRLAAAGLPIKIVLLLDECDDGRRDPRRARRRRPIKSLKGKKVAYEAGTTSDILLRYALAQNGMKFSDIKPVPTPAANAGVAALAGKVDAAVTYEPYLTTALNQNKGFKLIYTAAENPGLIGDVFVVRNDVLQEKPGQILALIKAWGAAVGAVPHEQGPVAGDHHQGGRREARATSTTAFDGVILYNLAAERVAAARRATSRRRSSTSSGSRRRPG